MKNLLKLTKKVLAEELLKAQTLIRGLLEEPGEPQKSNVNVTFLQPEKGVKTITAYSFIDVELPGGSVLRAKVNLTEGRPKFSSARIIYVNDLKSFLDSSLASQGFSSGIPYYNYNDRGKVISTDSVETVRNKATYCRENAGRIKSIY